MPAFYWLMNQTEHIREYLTESEYRKSSTAKHSISYFIFFVIAIIKTLL